MKPVILPIMRTDSTTMSEIALKQILRRGK